MGIFLEKALSETLALQKKCVKNAIESPKVSIIVPAYNTEKYISRCLSSLISQTLKEIEIIIVDDGSTDDTSLIAEEFSKADARIKIITQTNQKQGAARNNGSKIATGEYIGYIDSDDWIDLEYFEKLYNSAKKYNADIALATNIRIGKNKYKKRLNITKEEVFTTLQEKFDACRQYKNECPTNKIYKLSLLKENNITWPEGCYCEDKLFTAQAIYYAKKLVTVPGINYYYYQNPTSTVNTRSKKHSKVLINDKNAARKAVIEFLKEKNAPIRDKEFWAIKKEINFYKIPIITIKESLHTERCFLFSFIKLGEKTYD